MKILLGMSGGIDSTYAAVKLKSEGHTVEGAVLVMHEYTELDAARQAAESVGIPLHEIDCRKRFDEIVKRNFIEEYKNARTPNPCIICNSEIKFRLLCDEAKKCGFDKIATGHYASIVKLFFGENVRYAIARPRDTKKDQTYMLWRLSQDILSMLMFPLSDSVKADVRDAARLSGLAVADREESQEICFIPDGDYAAYIESRYGKSEEGWFVDEEGRRLGRHKGIIHYTVGQRKGLGIAHGKRAFINNINVEKNEITLGFDKELCNVVSVSDIVFSGMEPPTSPVTVECEVKLRYQARPTAASVTIFPDMKAKVDLVVPQPSVTPGQSAVFYKDNTVLFGGFIDR
jgi:tRNA-specific 2-thiouridylase